MAAMGQSRRENLSKCQSADPDTKIVGCTALIQAGQDAADNLSTIYNNLGVAYEDKGDYDRAIQDFNETIRLKPSIAAPFYGRGEAYDHKGDYDRAIQDYNEAIRLKPNFVFAYNARGAACRNKGEYDRAIQDYSQAIRLDSNYALAYNNRGESYYHKGEYDRAIQDYNEAIRLKPNLATAHYNRGLAYFLQTNLTAAVADFEHAISASPSPHAAVNAAVMMHLAIKRQGHDDAHQLASVASAADLSKWPGPVLKLDLGQMTAAEVMAAAANADAQSQKWQVCEANYFTGEDALLHHQRTKALARLKSARDGCPKSDGMYDAALAELKRLGAPAIPAK